MFICYFYEAVCIHMSPDSQEIPTGGSLWHLTSTQVFIVHSQDELGIKNLAYCLLLKQRKLALD